MTTHADRAADSTVLNVLVVGTGVVGKAVLSGLLVPANSNRVRAFALIRPAALLDAEKRAVVDLYQQRGVQILEGDLNDDIASLTQTLYAAHINTVVSTVGFGQYMTQLRLLEAAKAAGVRHFLPSEYGFDIPLVGPGSTLDGVLGPKHVVQRAVIDSGLDYTIVYTGGFTEFLLGSPLFGVDLKAGVITAPGAFSNYMNFTAIVDITNIVTDAVLRPEVSRDKAVYLGEKLSYQQIADTIDSVSATPLVRQVRTTEEALAVLKETPADYAARFVPVIDAQKGVWWPVEQTYAYQQLPGYKITTLRQLVEPAVSGAQTAKALSTVQAKAAARDNSE